ncbi:hypothetical protein [Actinoplanes sp. NPDC049118]|uniref:hypothetical protein n=1 Tax=Actinoplanes sp. NPDC049118 TaxID=3155769 RepID=UPI0033E61437
MDGYGIQIDTESRGTSRFRAGGAETWDIEEAEALAFPLLESRRARYVTFGNGEHEFRIWGENVSDLGNFNDTDTGPRWSDWYVDVEINGHRWVYRPCAELSEYPDADELAETAASLAPDVTRVWLGRSDGSEEHVSAVED